MEEKKYCKFCGQIIDGDALVCSFCGRRLDTENIQFNQNSNNMNVKGKKFYEKNWFLWLMLILITPVGIFLLWKYHPKMKKTLKIILTIVFAIYFFILGVSTEDETTSIDSNNNEQKEENNNVIDNLEDNKNESKNENKEDEKENPNTKVDKSAIIYEDSNFIFKITDYEVKSITDTIVLKIYVENKSSVETSFTFDGDPVVDGYNLDGGYFYESLMPNSKLNETVNIYGFNENNLDRNKVKDLVLTYSIYQSENFIINNRIVDESTFNYTFKK